MVKEFNSLEEIQKYYDKDTNTYVFEENGSYIDLVVLNFYLSIDANIEAFNINIIISSNGSVDVRKWLDDEELKNNILKCLSVEKTTRCNSVWLECLLWEQDAAGSSPVTSTIHINCSQPFISLWAFLINIFRGVAQFGRALRSGRRGRKFKSCHLDHKACQNI